MLSEGYVKGSWKDSAGNINTVRYKGKWGEHIFTQEENNRLLLGEEISFFYKKRIVTGHLQYYNFKGRVCFGFKSNYPDSEYDRNPVYHDISGESSFEIDLEKENVVMSEYMRRYYYSRLSNNDKSKLTDFRKITDINLQKEGVDVTYTLDNKHYVIDEKAQMDYIYEREPLPTFSLELLNAASGNIGWLINLRLKTEYYMFIWPHAEVRPLSVDNILYAYYALVNKKRLLAEIEIRYKMNSNHLFEYAKQMATGMLGEKVTDAYGRCKGYRYKGNGFDSQAYLYYSINKAEHPVNLVVRRNWLETISESHGKIEKGGQL